MSYNFAARGLKMWGLFAIFIIPWIVGVIQGLVGLYRFFAWLLV